MDPAINLKTKEVLNQILTSRIRETMNKFMVRSGVAVIVSIGLIIFLAITTINRLNDPLYVANNLLLGIIAAFSLYSALYSWDKLQNNRYNQPLKEWLEYRINLLNKEHRGKLSKSYLYLLPVIYILTVLSIHVYYENQLFLEVLHNPESLIGMAVGTPIGLGVAYISVWKIRKYQLKNLKMLQDLHQCL